MDKAHQHDFAASSIRCFARKAVSREQFEEMRKAA